MAYIVMANIGMAYIVMANIVMAYIVMAYTVMAYIVMAYIVMAYTAVLAHTAYPRAQHISYCCHTRRACIFSFWPAY